MALVLHRNIAAALAFGAWAGTYAPQVAANLPTPGLGLIERVDVYSFYLWLVLLAVMLLRELGWYPLYRGDGIAGAGFEAFASWPGLFLWQL